MGRRTIGYLTHFKDGFTDAWLGARAAAAAHDAHLVTFAAIKAWEAGELARATDNLTLFAQIEGAGLDGLVSPYFARLLEPERFFAAVPEDWRRLAASVRGLQGTRCVPLVEPTAACPGVEADMRAGTRALTRHLLEAHGRRRIAFINGPDVASNAERYAGYRDALAEQGIAVDDRLVTPCRDWEPETGRAGIVRLLARRGPAPEAVVSACDLIALGAIERLQERGLRVPYDVAVVGMDSDAGLNFQSPCALTSLYQPFFEMGARGVERAVSTADGLAHERLPANQLVIRHSCGCLSSSADGARRAGDPFAGVRARLRDALLDGNPSTPSRFARVLEQALSERVAAAGTLGEWQGLVSDLRTGALAAATPETSTVRTIEDRCHDARIFLGEAWGHAEGRRRWHGEQRQAGIASIMQELGSVLSLEALYDAFAGGAQRLGIPAWYVVQHVGSAWPATEARFLLGARGGTRIAPRSDAPFPARQLLPAGLLPTGRRLDLLVRPLLFRANPIGTVVFEVGPDDGVIHTRLADALGSALEGIRLYDEAAAARRAAEEADRLKSRFLSMVSHELRTPLSLIVGLSELMRDGPARARSPRDAQRVAQIHGHAQHLGGLIRDVLDLASNQVGQLKLAREVLDLPRTLALVAEAGEQMARAKGLRWQARFDKKLPRIYGDADRLRQVAMNMVSNAVKFTTRGTVSLRVQRDGDGVRVSVADTGLGIPLDQQAIIFDEFRQSERSTARGYGGLGLGLAIAKRLVERHGGAIGVSSSGKENAGAAFHFTLPGLSDTSVPVHAGGVSGAVRVIAEHAERGEALCAHLAREGFETELRLVPARRDWLPDVLAAPPGALVVDAPLAASVGWKGLQVLKEHPETRSMPFLLYAAEGAAASVVELDCLAKPVDRDRLGAVLDRVGGKGDGARKTILIVDDEPGLLELHAHAVARHWPEASVLAAGNGRQALATMRKTRPDLVLLDLMMPELDGFGVLEAMQASRPLRDVPVVILTAQALTQAEMERFNRGVAVVLEKGLFSMKETLAHLDRSLARSERLGGEGRRVVRKAMAYVHEHYPEPIVRADIARHVCVGERHLDRYFREEAGITPMKYLNRYRVRQAKALLRESEKSVTNVALEVGFSGSSYFGEIFRRETGMSPREFRERRR